MFSKKKTLVFHFNREQIIPLHMWFVFHSIDVFYLNRDKVVVEVKKQFKPFTFHTNNKKAQYLIETPIKNLKINIGDKLNF